MTERVLSEQKHYPSSILLSELKDIKKDDIPPYIRRVIDMGEKAVVLVMGGGGAKSTQHIGVVAAFLENMIPINLTIGTSAGAVATLPAKVGSLQELLHAKYLAERVDWNDITERRLLVLKDLNKLSTYLNFHRADIKDPYKHSPSIIVTVDKTEKPYDTRLFWHFEDPDLLAKAIQASCSIPYYFGPKTIDDRKLFDGGVVSENLLPTAVSDILTPEALTIEVNVSGANVNHNPKNILIEPSKYQRNGAFDWLNFHPDDVWLGYNAAQLQIPKILNLMHQKNIDLQPREGFTNETNLAYYFSQRNPLNFDKIE